MNIFKCNKCGMLIETIGSDDADLTAMNSNLSKL